MGYAGVWRRNQPSERYIERHNRRLFKRMCPYESGFAPPLGHTSPSMLRTRKTKHWIFILPYPDTPSLLPPPTLILSAVFYSLSLSLSSAASSLSPRPNAAHNSRSQFSISADFSIRLRGAAVPTRGTRHISFVAGCPSSPTPGCRTGTTISRIEKRWGSLSTPSVTSSFSHVRITEPRRCDARRDWKKRRLEGSNLCALRIQRISFQ